MKKHTSEQIAAAKENIINTVIFLVFILVALFIENFI